ncbi:MAG: class I SAM-dependent methyltransferase [Deltaproteobacteria bacterium]|nr:class I SAM-dependent methyltransferase [Deltaproteobacteria bacterium]MBN2671371.1 class I SAM-dependent methyltransferase [Deltaproteobacteria bacterium]
MIPSSEKWPAQADMLTNRVRKNQRRLKGWLKKTGVSCYRLYHTDIPEIPLLIDWYEGKLHVGVKIKGVQNDPAENEWIQFLIQHLSDALNIAGENVFIKYRVQGTGGAQYTAVANEARIFHVHEGGHQFVVNLSDYLDTGLFLDHRVTRQMVQHDAAGKRFLNLFAYTGSFTVYAAAGGAVATTTVDLSNTYLNAAKINMELNGFTGGSHRYQKHDVLRLLRRGEIREMYDLVVMDAPTISKSKSMKQNLVIQKDYIWMLNALLASVSRDGAIYFSCNLSNFTFNASQVAASHVEEITHQTVPPDFSGKPPHKCFRLVK